VDEHVEFMGLVLDDEGLHTPVGLMALGDLTRAEFAREVVRDGEGPTTQGTPAPAVIGGALVGGALLGGAGAVGGALLGSTVKQEVPGTPRFRTASVKLVFETQSSDFSMEIPRDKEVGAHKFAQTVERAMKKHRR